MTKTQAEQRHAIVRAVRSGNTEQLNAAVLTAYGWTGDLEADDLLERLTTFGATRIRAL